jgi:hypothetical protein
MGNPHCFHVRCQDRDELGRIFTIYNAQKNGLGEDLLSARTEPLLCTEENKTAGQAWDLILSNVPAKAGLPVLEDFTRRSAKSLNHPGGRALIVVVNTLAGFFEEQIKACSSLISRVNGPGHTVFLYGPAETNSFNTGSSFSSFKDEGLLKWNPSYLRNSATYKMEKTPYHLDTIYGAESFDHPGGDVLTAAKLTARLEGEIRSSLQTCCSSKKDVLVWEGGQGHFSAWFAECETHNPLAEGRLNFVLAGRNILALEAACFNTVKAMGAAPAGRASYISAADLCIDSEKILQATGMQDASSGFSFAAVFPKAVPQTDRVSAFWEALNNVCLPGAVIIIGASSHEAERFDRAKPKGFTRLGNIRQKGFRALSYRKKR